MQRELNLINPDRLLAFTAREYRKEKQALSPSRECGEFMDTRDFFQNNYIGAVT